MIPIFLGSMLTDIFDLYYPSRTLSMHLLLGIRNVICNKRKCYIHEMTKSNLELLLEKYFARIRSPSKHVLDENLEIKNLPTHYLKITNQLLCACHSGIHVCRSRIQIRWFSVAEIYTSFPMVKLNCACQNGGKDFNIAVLFSYNPQII